MGESMLFFLLTLGAYLLGTIPFGLWIGRLWARIDVREHGSGNIGVSNVLRTVGVVPAIIVLILDVSKGLVPVLVAKAFLTNEDMWLVVGLSAIVGHTLPIFLKFKGGRGVATASGVMLGLAIEVVFVLFLIWITTLLVSRYISLSSILAAIALPICLAVYQYPSSYIIFGVLLAILIIWRHRPNIQRLLAGTEYHIGEKARKN